MVAELPVHENAKVESLENKSQASSRPVQSVGSRVTWEDDDDYFGNWESMSSTTSSPPSDLHVNVIALSVLIRCSPIGSLNGHYTHSSPASAFFKKSDGRNDCYLYKTTSGYWMLTDSEEDISKDVGYIRSSVRYPDSTIADLVDVSEEIGWNVFNRNRWHACPLVSVKPDSCKFKVIHHNNRPCPIEVIVTNKYHPTLSGSYFLNTDLTSSTPVWSTLDSACYLYLTSSGYWMITDSFTDIASNTGYSRSNRSNFRSPSDVTSWLIYENGRWVTADGIAVAEPR